MNGRLEGRSAGGHPGNPSHMHNPQYRLEVDPEIGTTGPGMVGALQVIVKTGASIPINVKAVWGDGRVIE